MTSGLRRGRTPMTVVFLTLHGRTRGHGLSQPRPPAKANPAASGHCKSLYFTMAACWWSGLHPWSERQKLWNGCVYCCSARSPLGRSRNAQRGHRQRIHGHSQLLEKLFSWGSRPDGELRSGAGTPQGTILTFAGRSAWCTRNAHCLSLQTAMRGRREPQVGEQVPLIFAICKNEPKANRQGRA